MRTCVNPKGPLDIKQEGSASTTTDLTDEINVECEISCDVIEKANLHEIILQIYMNE